MNSIDNEATPIKGKSKHPIISAKPTHVINKGKGKHNQATPPRTPITSVKPTHVNEDHTRNKRAAGAGDTTPPQPKHQRTETHKQKHHPPLLTTRECGH